MKKMAEFNGERARLYESAIGKYPRARLQDIVVMKKLLNPKKGDFVLGFGEGNGYFCEAIARAVGNTGEYLITDPSGDQLKNLKKRINLPQVKVVETGAEKMDVSQRHFDKIWSFGAFHHCPNQTAAIKRIYGALKIGGIAVICDVFQGSSLAKHFDSQVARFCITGHESKFLSEEFAKSLCVLAGFKEGNIRIVKLSQKWIFDSEEDLGEFIYGLHAMTLLTGNRKEKIRKTLEGCRNILGMEKKNGKHYLNWEMKALVVKK